MTQLDADIIPVIQQLLAEFGKLATFSRIGTAIYDPATGAVTETGVTAPTGLITPPTPWQVPNRDKTTVVENALVTFTFPGFEPLIGMQMTLDAQQWRITEVWPIYSGELICLYKLKLEI